MSECGGVERARYDQSRGHPVESLSSLRADLLIEEEEALNTPATLGGAALWAAAYAWPVLVAVSFFALLALEEWWWAAFVVGMAAIVAFAYKPGRDYIQRNSALALSKRAKARQLTKGFAAELS